MTRFTSTRAQLSREQLEAIIATIELVCKLLLGLIPILKGLLGRVVEAEKVIAGRKGK